MLKRIDQVRKRHAGFSLLEIIIVLALIGLFLAGLAHYKQKQLQKIAREQVANTLVKEMYGLLKFINEDEVAMNNSSSLMINPLYTKNKNGVNSYKDVFYKRVQNTGLLDNLQTTDYLTWSDTNSQRQYFTNRSCDGTGSDPTSGEVDRNFEVDYISCKLSNLALTGNMQFDRIDLVGSATDPLAIDRIDFIVKYVPDTKGEEFYFENFKPEFDAALSGYKFNYSQAVVLRRNKGSSVSQWKQILVGSGSNTHSIEFGTVSGNVSDLGSPQNNDYAIRFSFVTGVGKYPKADGSVGVDKQCWNINSQMSGPCIAAKDADKLSIYSGTGSTSHTPGLCWDSKSSKSLPCLSVAEGQGVNKDDQVMRLTTEKNNQTVTGTLMANIIVENTGNLDGTGQPELLTIPVVEYRAFGNDFTNGKKDNTYIGNVSTESGTMKVNVQKCPVAPGGREMYPRLVAAISSVAADVGVDVNNQSQESDFANVAQNRTHLGAVGRLAGVALQVNLNSKDTDWTVSSTSAVYDNATGLGVNLINSTSVSVVLTSWCSTIPQ
ncbi:prepilin-type N-terminal cleavage/methylation domain-containing protein [Enterobacteriaceae bacterium ML5]|nr:prepilin-type N-terminal cleavage/methylation domain-containing protein [Enterobacteriaceae bacterium ML5]